MAQHKGLQGTGLPQKDKPWRERCPHLGTWRWLDEQGQLQVLNKTTGELFTLEQLHNLHSRLLYGNDGTASQILNSWLTDPNRYLDDHEMHAHENGAIDFYCIDCDQVTYEKRRIYDTDMKAFIARCPGCGGYVPHVPPLAKEAAGGIAGWVQHQRTIEAAKRQDNADRSKAARMCEERVAANKQRREAEAKRKRRVAANAGDKLGKALDHLTRTPVKRTPASGPTRVPVPTRKARTCAPGHNGPVRRKPVHGKVMGLQTTKDVACKRDAEKERPATRRTPKRKAAQPTRTPTPRRQPR